MNREQRRLWRWRGDTHEWRRRPEESRADHDPIKMAGNKAEPLCFGEQILGEVSLLYEDSLLTQLQIFGSLVLLIWKKFIRRLQSSSVKTRAFYSVIHLLVVDVSCVLFLTQSACMVPKQNTRNIYHKQMNNRVD